MVKTHKHKPKESGKSAAAEEELRALQIALVEWQKQAMESDQKVLVIFEGRDAAGKDGTIRRIVEHLHVRATRAVALPKPSDRERTQWYFQRYVAHLPSAGELTIFNRSWYNRAGVEKVMGFSEPEEQERFLREVPGVEAMLAESGITLIKLWLDISREEQAQRLKERATDPIKALKTSPLDAVAQEKWDAYTAARDVMLTLTHTAAAPWMCVRADKKKRARPAVIRHILQRVAPEPAKSLGPPDPSILFPFEAAALADGRLAR